MHCSKTFCHKLNRSVQWLSVPRVRVTFQDRHRPVNLLGKNRPCKFMGKGHRRERQQQIGLAAPSRGQSIGTSHEKYDIASGLTMFINHLAGKSLGIEGFAKWVEHDFEGRCVNREQVESVRVNFAAFASDVPAGALEELRGELVGMLIPQLAVEVKKDLHIPL